MKLSEQQFIFSRNFYKLFGAIFAMGYEVTFGECYRTTEQALWNSQHGLGIKKSLHCDRMAIDLNIWKDGVLSNDPEDYSKAGKYWKALNPLNRWGGDFSTLNDYYHFEMQEQ